MEFADHRKCHQGYQPQSGTSKSSSTPERTLEMSSIFEEVLDAFKLIRVQPNFKHSFFSECGDHPKCHQEPPQRLMIFVDFWLELMMILMFLTGAGILDDVLDGLHMP